MNWTETFDGYCERLDPSFWAEPVNAVTNAAFLIAAVIMVYRLRRSGLVGAYVLVLVLSAIGVGSFLFHTFATGWAALADVAPIGAFILIYLFLVHRFMVGWSLMLSLVATSLFIPYAALLTPALGALPFFEISSFYWTVPVLLFAYAFVLRGRLPSVAKGMAIGGGLLVISITLRSVDMPLCDGFPLGTHFLWHCLNAVMLGWMIEVYRRHSLASTVG